MKIDFNDIVLTDEQLLKIQEKYVQKINEAIDEIDIKELSTDIQNCIKNDISEYLFDGIDLSNCSEVLADFAEKAVKNALKGGK